MVKIKKHDMFFTKCVKKTKMPLKLIGAFSILVLVGMLVSNTGIEKSFAKERVALLPLTSADAELNANVAQFLALCYNDVFESPK